MALSGRWSADLIAGVVGGVVITLFLRFRFAGWFENPEISDPLQSTQRNVPSDISFLFGYSPYLVTFAFVFLLSVTLVGILLVVHRRNRDSTGDTVFGSVILASLLFTVPTFIVFGVALNSIINPEEIINLNTIAMAYDSIGSIFVLIFAIIISVFFAALAAASVSVIILTDGGIDRCLAD